MDKLPEISRIMFVGFDEKFKVEDEDIIINEIEDCEPKNEEDQRNQLDNENIKNNQNNTN